MKYLYGQRREHNLGHEPRHPGLGKHRVHGQVLVGALWAQRLHHPHAPKGRVECHLHGRGPHLRDVCVDDAEGQQLAEHAHALLHDDVREVLVLGLLGGLPGRRPRVREERLAEGEGKGLVHNIEVRRVRPVFRDVLYVAKHVVFDAAVVAGGGAVQRVDAGDLPGRGVAVDVVPDEHHLVELLTRPLLQAHVLGGQALGVRNVGTLTVAVKLPTVEGALDVVTNNLNRETVLSSSIKNTEYNNK